MTYDPAPLPGDPTAPAAPAAHGEPAAPAAHAAPAPTATPAPAANPVARWWRRLTTEARGTEWWVVKLVVLALVLVAILAARPERPWLWVPLGCALGAIVAYGVLEGAHPRLAVGIAAAGAMVAAFVAVPTSTGPILMAIAVIDVAANTRIDWPVVVGVSGATVAAVIASTLVWRGSALGTLVNLFAVVAITMLGWSRRQSRLRNEQTRLLLEQTRAAQQERARAAALDERARISRELHDVLAHALGSLGVQLEVAEALLADGDDPEGALERVRRSRRLAAEGLAEARRAVAALREDLPPLPEALGELVRTHAIDHERPATLDLAGTPRPLSTGATVSLLGTAREALTNAGRHAPGAPVAVTLRFGNPGVRLTVRNALVPESRTPLDTDGPGGHGLTGMRERLALVDGTLTAGVVPGVGAGAGAGPGAVWVVEAEVPE